MDGVDVVQGLTEHARKEILVAVDRDVRVLPDVLERRLDPEIFVEVRVGSRIVVIEPIVRRSNIQQRARAHGEHVVERVHVVVAMLRPFTAQGRHRKAVAVAELDAPVGGARDEHAMPVAELVIDACQIRVVPIEPEIWRCREVVRVRE